MANRAPVRIFALLAALGLAACASTAPKPVPPPPPPPVAQPAPSPPARPSSGDDKFAAFLAEARSEALAQGITAESFDSATAGIAPLTAIIAMNDNQPEFTKPVWSYLDSAVSARRIKDAQFMLSRYGDVLDTISTQSGVPKENLVSVWGKRLWRRQRQFPTAAALATLA
jgi:membrane-bound lytic murein transglycosylase B